MAPSHRIHGELLKLGIDIGQTSVAKYMARRRRPPSQGWSTFLRNHADGIAAMDLFVVPTISFRLLYGLLVMGHGRRQILWFGVTAHPTAEWVANQLTEACGWEQIPGYLIRDRDGAYGEIFIRRLRSIGIRDRPTSPRSPWQNAYAERLIGSIRKECIDHVVVFGEGHLRHLLLTYMSYYNGTRTHLSLNKDAPVSRAAESTNPGRATPPIRPDLVSDRDSATLRAAGARRIDPVRAATSMYALRGLFLVALGGRLNRLGVDLCEFRTRGTGSVGGRSRRGVLTLKLWKHMACDKVVAAATCVKAGPVVREHQIGAEATV